MKALLFILIPFILSGQVELLPFDSETKKVRYEYVFDFPNTTKNELYIRSKNWISDHFKSEKAVIQTDEKEDGLIIIKAHVPILWKLYDISDPKKGKRDTVILDIRQDKVEFTLKIYLKDNKAKFILTDIFEESMLGGEIDELFIKVANDLEVTNDPEHYGILKHHRDIAKSINEDFINTLVSLKNELTKPKKNESEF